MEYTWLIPKLQVCFVCKISSLTCSLTVGVLISIIKKFFVLLILWFAALFQFSQWSLFSTVRQQLYIWTQRLSVNWIENENGVVMLKWTQKKNRLTLKEDVNNTHLGKKVIMKELHINEITSRTTKWRARVLVEEMNNIFEFAPGKKLLKLVLRDEQGDQVQGLIWTPQITSLSAILRPFKTYYIGEVSVHPVKEGYTSSSYGLTTQWSFGKNCYVLPVTEKEKEIPYPMLPFVPYEQLPSHMHNDTPVDCLAVVIKVHSLKRKPTKHGPTPVQELTVLRQDWKPLLLSLWGEFATNHGAEVKARRMNMPILLCKRLKISGFSGVLFLATTAATNVEVDPDIPQALELRNWSHNNADQIKAVAENTTNENSDPSSLYNPDQRLIPVAHIIPDTKNAWVKVKIIFQQGADKLYFTSCPECAQATSARNSEKFYCLSCQNFQTAVPRCRAVAKLEDQSGSIKATFYDKNAERLLQQSALQIYNMKPEDTNNMITELQSTMKHQEFIAEIKTSREKYSDRISRHTIQTWFPAENLPPTKVEGASTSTSSVAKHFPVDKASNYTGETKIIETPSSQDIASEDKDASNPQKKLKLKGGEEIEAPTS